MRSGEDGRARYGLIVAITSVSLAAILIRTSDSHFLAIAFFRLLLATLILVPLALYFEREWFGKLDLRDWMIISGSGFALSLHFSFWIASLNHTSVAASVVLVTAHPAVVAVLSFAAFGERPSRLVVGGIGVSFGGILIIGLGSNGQGGNTLWGNLLALVGMMAIVFYLLAGRSMRRRVPVLVYAVGVYSVCSAFLLVFCLLYSVPLTGYPRDEWLLFLGLALVPHILGHTVYNWTLRYVSASVVSVSLLGEPVLSSIWAYLLLSENPGTVVIAGGAVTLAGIYMVSRGRITISSEESKKPSLP